MKKILIDAMYPQEIRVAKVTKDNKILNFDYESSVKKQLKGNIYLAKVTRVEPSLQAAFVEYSDNKHGFLPFVEIHPDYYQIPAEDKKKLEKDVFSSNSNSDSESNERLDKIVSAGDSDEDDQKATTFESQKRKLIKNYKIQEVIKKNQLILVQVIKEERGNKGVSLSTYISIAGRCCVLMPNNGSKTGGVSRRIEGASDRKRLRELIKSLTLPAGTSVILRTAATAQTNPEIKKDYNYLVTLWNNIRKDTLSASAPALVYEEADVIKRTIRDLYSEDVTEIVVEGSSAISQIKKFLNVINPNLVKKVKAYKNKQSIFDFYKIEKEIERFYHTNAPLASGGYLVINITEALISIDVNSGKANKERSVEEMALKTNLEAAREVARQLQLRDLSGLIVIDFIDMVEVDNRKNLEKELRKAFEGDKARIQIGRVSYFGLVEMSRQRLKPSLIESNMIACSHCSGTGYVKSPTAVSIEIFRSIRSEIVRHNPKVIKIYSTSDCIAHMINFKRNNILSIEKTGNLNIFLYVDNGVKAGTFKVESSKSLSPEDIEKLGLDTVSNISNISSKKSNDRVNKHGLMKKICSKFAS